MPYWVEIIRFTVADDDVATFLDRRREAIAEVKSAHPALWSVPLCSRRDDARWTDVWIYETKEAAEAANADTDNLPKFQAMAELLDEVDIETSEMPVDAVCPI